MTGAIKKKKQKPLCQTQLTCSVTTKKKKRKKIKAFSLLYLHPLYKQPCFWRIFEIRRIRAPVEYFREIFERNERS